MTLESKISGPNNGMWKGDDVGVNQLHAYLRTRIPKPEKCELCKLEQPYDLANKTGVYNRDFENWYWLCRKCHMKSDGRLERLAFQSRTASRNGWIKRYGEDWSKRYDI